MTMLDRLRIASALVRYDFWLDSRGVPGAARRELRAELRGNLTAATAHEGSRAALLGIGSPRALAHAAAEAHEGRPRWSFGGILALAVGGVLFFAWIFSVLGFADGVDASGVTGREVSGQLFPWGSSVSAEFGGGGGSLAVGGTVPWVIPVVAFITFVIASRPWRLVTARRGTPAAQRG